MPARPGRNKKLEQAARLIAVGRIDDVTWSTDDVDRVIEDMIEFGAPAAVIEEMRAEHAAKAVARTFDVFPENAVAVRLFNMVQTQWVTVGLGTMSKALMIKTGLDYLRVEATARMARIDLDDKDFDRLRFMEGHALAAFAEEARG